MSRRVKVRRPAVCPRCGVALAWARHVPADPSRMAYRDGRGAGLVPLERDARDVDDASAEYAALPSLAQARHIGAAGALDPTERRYAHHVHVSPQCREALFPPRPVPLTTARSPR